MYISVFLILFHPGTVPPRASPGLDIVNKRLRVCVCTHTSQSRAHIRALLCQALLGGTTSIGPHLPRKHSKYSCPASPMPRLRLLTHPVLSHVALPGKACPTSWESNTLLMTVIYSSVYLLCVKLRDSCNYHFHFVQVRQSPEASLHGVCGGC